MKRQAVGAAIVMLLLAAAAYAAFFVAPTDSKQGVIYRIIFLHVPCAETGIRQTRRPARARPAARLTLVVVLPTPPF